MNVEVRTKVISRQSGAVLAIALIFLVVLTLLGITGAQNTIMEERMSGNFRDQQIAFEAAEAAMRTAEAVVLETATFDNMLWDGSDGTYGGEPSQDYEGNTSPITVSVTEISAATSADPTYYIERLAEVPPPQDTVMIGFTPPPTIRYYRVTAKGWGQSTSNDPQVILQSTLYRP